MEHLIPKEETQNLKSQFATSNKKWGGRRYFPHAFTEQGIAMLSSVLNLEELEKRYDSQFKIVFDVIRQLMTPPIRDRKEIGFKPNKN